MIASLHEDGEILVLDKPAGLAVQPGEGVHTCLLDVVERDFGFRPFLVHRLDKETSGLIIVARDAKSAARWTKALGSRDVGKFYRAVTSGALAGSSGRITTPIRVRGESFPADTGWRLLSRFAGFSWLELELGTGRTHQIRLHLAEAGSPILGDDRHGDFALNRALRKNYGLKRLLLVSWRLVLPDGTTLRASLPEHFAAFFGQFPDAPDPELA